MMFEVKPQAQKGLATLCVGLYSPHGQLLLGALSPRLRCVGDPLMVDLTIKDFYYATRGKILSKRGKLVAGSKSPARRGRGHLCIVGHDH